VSSTCILPVSSLSNRTARNLGHSLFQSATFCYIYLYSLPVIFSKKESETVILKIIRYRHLFVHGLDRGLGFQTSMSESESKSLARKSESKSESSGSKSKSESESAKTGLESGLESKSGLEYYKSGTKQINLWNSRITTDVDFSELIPCAETGEVCFVRSQFQSIGGHPKTDIVKAWLQTHKCVAQLSVVVWRYSWVSSAYEWAPTPWCAAMMRTCT